MAKASTSLSDRVAAALREREWLVELDEEIPGGMLLSPSDGPAPWAFLGQVDDEDGVVAFYSLLPLDVPEAHREDVARVLTHANYALQIGCFEIDLSDGEVTFRTSVDLGEVVLDDAQLAALVSPLVARNLAGMDAWIDPISEVAGGADPAPYLT